MSRGCRTQRGPRRIVSNRCPICGLPWATRELLELAARTIGSLGVVARYFGLSRGQLRRHLDTCGG